MTLLYPGVHGSSLTPLWWRVPVWTAMTVATVIWAADADRKIATAVVMGLGAIVLQFCDHPRGWVRITAVLGATVSGLAVSFISPKGLAYALVVVAASRAPKAFDGLALRWFTIVDALAFGITVGVVSHSLAGYLAGAVIPALVQRAIEHRDLVRERDRAQALLAEVQGAREAEAQAAALRERGRIAREMHDVLAHSLAGLSVQLQAVRAVAAREHAPQSVLEPLDKAASLAKDGLAEARGAVSALRDPVGLGLAELPALVARHPGDANLHTVGTPGEVSAEAGHAIYRAVQESLTNAARYAPGAAADVTLTWSADTLQASVTDSGRAPDRDPVAGAGTGLGLAGMAERVEQAGGTLHAGPDGPGWRVLASVPAVAVVPAR